MAVPQVEKEAAQVLGQLRGEVVPLRRLWDSADRAAEAEVPAASQRRGSFAIFTLFCLDFCSLESFLAPLLLL